MAFEDAIKGNTGLGTKVVTEEDVAYDECPNKDCHLYNTEEEKCTFETCMYSQLPIHDKALINKCIICDTDFKMNVEKFRIPICEDCMKALRHIVIGHRNYCVECEKIEKESEFDQYLKEGDDPSNESRDSEYYASLSD